MTWALCTNHATTRSPMPWTPTDVPQILIRAMFTSRLVCSFFKVSCPPARPDNSRPPPPLPSRRMFILRLIRHRALASLRLLSGVPQPPSVPLHKLLLLRDKSLTGIVVSTSFSRRAKFPHPTVLTSAMLGSPVLPLRALDRSLVGRSRIPVARLDRQRWVIPTPTRRITPYPRSQMLLVQAMNALLVVAMPLVPHVVLCRLAFPSLLLVPLDLLDPTVVLLPLLTRIVLSVLLLKSALFAMSVPLRQAPDTLCNSSTPVLPSPHKFQAVTPSPPVPRPLLRLLLPLRLPPVIVRIAPHLQ